jgi:two-component system, NarL family, response regulator DevR
MNPYTVLLVDDHQIVRQGLRSILESDPRYDITGEAANGAEAIAQIKTKAPDIVVLDLKLPDTTGAKLCRKILSLEPKTIVFILTAYYEHQMVYACLQAGARGYLIKDATQLNLPEQLMTAVQGHTTLDPRAADILADYVRKNISSEDSLTGRELDVIRLLAQGLTNSEIALQLKITGNTVKSYLKEIFSKLSAHNRVEAVMEARKRDLL